MAWAKHLMNVGRHLREVTPPMVWRGLLRVYNSYRPDLEYLPGGWDDAKIKGWDDRSVLETQVEHWPDFLRSIEGANPLDVGTRAYPPGRTDLSYLVRQNVFVIYGYILALASRKKDSLSLLDWGGAFGHYYPVGRALVPDVRIDYHCKDFPALAEHGRSLFPEAHFYSDESCLGRKYDLVYASSSLHYSRDWSGLFAKLARATCGYLALNRIPIVDGAPTFAYVQRAYAYGYDTEYLGWCVNRNELLEAARAAGLTLVREFLYEPHALIQGAPEQPAYRGFLFASR
jgi:putative methyltransferase (TIGR04325 family)